MNNFDATQKRIDGQLNLPDGTLIYVARKEFEELHIIDTI
jgi:hypothetical protein